MRRVLKSMVVVLAFFLLLEGAAAVAERTLIPRHRTIPLPRPGVEDPEFSGKITAARRSLEIPLAQNESGSWTLAPASQTVEGGVLTRINRLGLRGPDPVPKEDGEIRLFSLGDSSVFGYGVPERDVFTSVAAQALSARWSRNVTAWIGAVPGHSSEQSLQVLQEHGARYAPDWVIIANQWSDVFFQDKGARFVEKAAGPMRTFATYRVARLLLSPWLAARRVRFIDGGGDIGNAGNNRVPLPRYLDNLRRLGATSRSLGAQPAFLILPAPLDLDEVAPPEAVVEYRAAMRLVAEELDAPLVDGPEVFRDPVVTLGYFLDQVHPSEPGHHLLGEALVEALVARGP